MERKRKEKIIEEVEIEAEKTEEETMIQTMIPYIKANEGASTKKIKCKSKKSSTSEIDRDESEGSKHNSSVEEEVEKKKSKTYTGKQDKAVALIAGPSKKVYSGDRPYRAGFSALTAFVIDMRKKGLSLNAEQLKLLKETPFADLYMMITDNEYTTSSWNKIDDAVTNLLMCLKEATGKEIKFEFARRGETYTMTSTPEKLAVILGVPCIKGRWKETKRAMYGDSFRESPFYLKYFGETNSSSKPYIRDAIFKLLMQTEPPLTRRDNEDLVMLIGLFMCNTIFFTTKDAGAIKDKYLGLVQDFEKCKTFSWAQLIYSELAKRLKKGFNNPTKTTGCVFYLPIWFAEQTKIVKPIKLTKENFVPRASRWNLKQICKELLKDMETSNYLFRENFFNEITENEKVALGMSEEGGSKSFVEDGEERNQNLRMQIKTSWQVIQNLIANNVEVHPKMLEELKKLYFQAFPGELESLPNDITVDSDSTKERQVTEDVSSSVQSKNDTTPAAMMCTTYNDACVTSAEDLLNDSVKVQSNKATTDNSFTSRERDPTIDFACSLSNFSPLRSQKKMVELGFDEGVIEDNFEHEKLHDFTQLDDTDEVVENMELANILMTMKEKPEIAAPEQKIADANVDARAINPEKSNADANLTVPEPKNADAGAIDPEQSLADTDLTVPQPKHVVDAEPKNVEGKTLLADAEAKAGESKRKRKKIESTKGQDAAVKKKSKKDAKTVEEIIQQFQKEGLFDDETSKAGYSKTSLTGKKLLKEGLFDDKTSKSGNSNTYEKFPKDVEGNTSKDGLPLDTTNVKRKNMSVEVSSVATDVMTREDGIKKHDPMYTGGTDYSEGNSRKAKRKFNIDSREERVLRRNNKKEQAGKEPLEQPVVQKKKRVEKTALKRLQGTRLFKKLTIELQSPISIFFWYATVRSAAWTVHVGVEPNIYTLSVCGKTIEDLMYNEALEPEIISYTTYKLQKAFDEDQGKLGDKKYLKVLHIDPSAWTFVQDNVRYASFIEDAIEKPIIEMDNTVDRILIPMLHAVGHNKHWTLLIFYINKSCFEHFNSWDIPKDECLQNANVMAEFCSEYINRFLEANKKPVIDNIQVNEVQVPQQGPTKNCLLYVRHFIKKRTKYDFKNSKEVDFRSEEELLKKMEHKRIKLVHKLLTAKAPEISWKISDEQQK